MRARSLMGTAAATAVAGVVLGWPTWAAVTWARYGRVRRAARADPLLDRCLPVYEVAERHATRVAAPAALGHAAARDVGMQRSAVVRAIVRARERLLRVHGDDGWPAGGIVTQLRAWGWGVLAEGPGPSIVLGAITQPWRGDVVFRALPPEEFAAFREPGWVKLVTLLAVEPLGPGASLFRVETRVATTDRVARARFRRYWAVFSPGIHVIRRVLLGVVRREAERRYREARRRPSLPARAVVGGRDMNGA